MINPKKIKEFIVYAAYAVYYGFARIISPVLKINKQYKNLWLICERKTDARDNGYHFFKYIRENHPKVNAVYIIEKKSPDYMRAANLGQTVCPNTLKHMLMFACAKVCISTHIMGYAPDTYRFAKLDEKFGMVHTKKVFLQHGIIKDDLKELYYPNVKLNLFVCTAVPEYNYVRANFKHPSGVVKRTGLCRYDRLLKINGERKPQKQILVMPTWRLYLRGMSEKEFTQSVYYKNYSKILNSVKTAQILNKYNYKLVFYLHYEMQPYSKLFKTNNSNIKIADFKNYDVQDLLINSSVLITDYSSVFFDFAYMKKPLAYFWFDEKEFFDSHYKKGYFYCRRDGFGPVFDNAEQIEGYIEDVIKNNAKMQDEYKRRAEMFFDYTSQKISHCEKTYNEICNIINKS